MIHISYHIYEIVDSKKKLFLNCFLFARFDSKSYFQFRGGGAWVPGPHHTRATPPPLFYLRVTFVFLFRGFFILTTFFIFPGIFENPASAVKTSCKRNINLKK